jgi:hypothetical protein
MICIEIMQEFSDRMNALSLLNVTDEEIERIVATPQNIISTCTCWKDKWMH